MRRRGSDDMLKLLLDKGADPNARLSKKVWYSQYDFDQSGVDETGATPFWRAAYAADVDAMKLMLKYGADPTIPTMRLSARRGPEDPAGGLPMISAVLRKMARHGDAGEGFLDGIADVLR